MQHLQATILGVGSRPNFPVWGHLYLPYFKACQPPSIKHRSRTSNSSQKHNISTASLNPTQPCFKLVRGGILSRKELANLIFAFQPLARNAAASERTRNMASSRVDVERMSTSKKKEKRSPNLPSV